MYSRTTRLPQSAVPDVDDAVQSYLSVGGRLTYPSVNRFSHDRLGSSAARSRRRQTLFSRRFSNFSSLFSAVANGNYRPFQDARLHMIQLTQQL